MISVVISAQDLEAVVARSRAAAARAGELTPPRVGSLSTVLPPDVRRALVEDLSSGEFRRALEEAAAEDPDLHLS